MEISKLLRIEYRGQVVLTSKQIADAYGCTVSNIRHNFNSNKDQFIEGVHYFKLEGAELKQFKEYVATVSRVKSVHTADAAENLPCTKLASSLYLWTKQGAVRHCKMVDTPMAWEVFTMLEKCYFGQIAAEETEQQAEQTAQPPQNYSNENPPPFWQLLKIIRDRILIKFAEKIIGEKLF